MSKPSLRVFYLIEVGHRTVGHQLVQDFLNCSRIPYRSTVADNHIEGLNDLMDQEVFRNRSEASDRD